MSALGRLAGFNPLKSDGCIKKEEANNPLLVDHDLGDETSRKDFLNEFQMRHDRCKHVDSGLNLMPEIDRSGPAHGKDLPGMFSSRKVPHVTVLDEYHRDTCTRKYEIRILVI